MSIMYIVIVSPVKIGCLRERACMAHTHKRAVEGNAVISICTPKREFTRDLMSY